ncbi:class I SAM-dependent methyltransferase [Limnohabitans sp.]|uniref:class I SAM-dependent methyltransferase n=1 Tax=Limnohabitans sp. TaxID=1907725 RepID=UPI0037BE7FB0
MQFQTHSSLLENLTGVPRTLLLPLAARAQGGSAFPTLDPHDRYAQELLAAIGAEVQTSIHDAPTVVSVLWRTGVIKAIGKDFFKRYPHSLGINLGAGLAHYFQWLGNGKNEWLDVDLKPVIDLRQSLIPETSVNCYNLAMDITQPGWWNRLYVSEEDQKRPVLVVCEGVLMYFQPSKVKSIIREIGENAPEGTELLLDFVSPLAIGPSALLAHPEEPDAPFAWGVHNGQEIAQYHERLELLSQHSVSEVYGMGATWAEMCWHVFTGGPLYGMAHLRVSEP